MKIDMQVEPLVREALAGINKRDDKRFEDALKAFPDDASRLKGVQLAGAIVGVVIFEMHGGQPSEEEVSALSGRISLSEGWIGASKSEIRTYLTALLEARPLEEVLAPEMAVLLSYVVAGYLLAACSKPDEGEWWFNYLDKVEEMIETGARQ